LNLRIKIDKTSWVVLSVSVISLILCIIALAAGKHTSLPLLVFSFLFFYVFYERLKEIKNSRYDVTQRNLLSDNRFKPEFDKYEITLFTIILSILIVVDAQFDGLINMNLFPLTIVVVVLSLIEIAYHIDRKNDWKKQQQALTQSTLQNSS
jgi:hypothetical protein